VTVKEFIRNVPIPVCGLAVGLASLDRFLSQNYDFYEYSIFALFSAIMILLFAMRIVTDIKGIKKDLESPILFSILSTCPMTLLILATYLFEVSDVAGQILWLASLVWVFAMMPIFFVRFVIKFDINKVFPSWFVMFVGSVVSSITSVAVGFTDIGKIVFWFGLISYAILMPVISYRALIVKKIPEPAIPNLAIFAAPANLLLVGYITVYGSSASDVLVGVLAAIGMACYFAVLTYMPFMLKRKFYPSYGAFTFPMVISMTSISLIGAFFDLSGGLYGVLETASVVIAVAMVVYVLIRYVMFFYDTAMKNSKSGV